jgi:hypothetical protein
MHDLDTSSLSTFSAKAKPPTSIASDSVDLSSIPTREVPELISLRRLERSEAVEPFDRLRAGFWHDWNGPRY